jgi:hypothetical protein
MPNQIETNRINELADVVLEALIERDPITADFLSTAIRKEISKIGNLSECIKEAVNDEYIKVLEQRIFELESEIYEVRSGLCSLLDSLADASTNKYETVPFTVSLEDKLDYVRSRLLNLKNRL